MTRFLHLFPTFRRLEDELHILQQELIQCRKERDHSQAMGLRAEQELTQWKQDASRWEAKYEAAREGEIKATQTVADFFAQRVLGRKIFEHTPVLPAKPFEEYKPIPKERQQVRRPMQMFEKFFDHQIAEHQKQEAAKLQARAKAITPDA